MSTIKYTTRKLALEHKAPFYFPLSPCVKCGTSKNYTSCYKCVQCKKDWELQWRLSNPQKIKTIQQKERTKNTVAYTERSRNYMERKGAKYMYELRSTYRQNNMGRVINHANARRIKKLRATPKWYNADECRLVYEAAQLLTNNTGISHHVDHIIPIVSHLVCGLHCVDNLQILPASENLEKSNKFSVD